MDIHDFNGTEALLINRYDRMVEDGKLIRFHQEDFYQALGIMPENKYEERGGPGLKQSIELIMNYSTNPQNDLRQFLLMIIFNFLIGNCDAHGKNFSFLYDPNLGKRHLAPFYDIVCSSVDERFDTDFAMEVCHERSLFRITRKDFESIASRILVNRLIDELLERFPVALSELKGQVPLEFLPLLQRIEEDSRPRQEALKR